MPPTSRDRTATLPTTTLKVRWVTHTLIQQVPRHDDVDRRRGAVRAGQRPLDGPGDGRYVVAVRDLNPELVDPLAGRDRPARGQQAGEGPDHDAVEVARRRRATGPPPRRSGGQHTDHLAPALVDLDLLTDRILPEWHASVSSTFQRAGTRFDITSPSLAIGLRGVGDPVRLEVPRRQVPPALLDQAVAVRSRRPRDRPASPPTAATPRRRAVCWTASPESRSAAARSQEENWPPSGLMSTRYIASASLCA